VVSQVVGAVLAAWVLYLIVQGQAGFAGTGGFATNGYAELSPGKYSLISALMIEIVLTAMFLIVIMGATDKRAPAGFAPIAIGLAETAALSQLWLFWVAPIVGAIIGAIIYKILGKED